MQQNDFSLTLYITKHAMFYNAEQLMSIQL